MSTVFTPELKELLKEEYTKTGISVRKLAAKYGIDRSTLGRLVTAEHWALLKKYAKNKPAESGESNESTESEPSQARQVIPVTPDEVLQAIFTAAERQELILRIADKTAMKYEQIVDLEEPLPPRDLKSMTGAIVDLMNIYGIKSAEDMREQKARIKALESRSEEKSPEDRAITVVFGNGEELV